LRPGSQHPASSKRNSRRELEILEREVAMLHVFERFGFMLLIFALAVVSFPGQVNQSAPSSTDQTTNQNNQPSVDAVDPGTASRGESVNVNGKFPSFEKIVIKLKRVGWSVQGTESEDSESGNESATSITVDEISVKDPKASFSFTVPLSLQLGRYQVLVTF